MFLGVHFVMISPPDWAPGQASVLKGIRVYDTRVYGIRYMVDTHYLSERLSKGSRGDESRITFHVSCFKSPLTSYPQDAAHTLYPTPHSDIKPLY